MTARTLLSAAAAFALAAPAAAQDAPRHSIGTDISYSSDADDTEVVRLGLNADVRYRGPDDYLGVRLERNIYRPSGLDRRRDARAYLRIARPLGDWALVGCIVAPAFTFEGFELAPPGWAPSVVAAAR